MYHLYINKRTLHQWPYAQQYQDNIDPAPLRDTTRVGVASPDTEGCRRRAKDQVTSLRLITCVSCRALATPNSCIIVMYLIYHTKNCLYKVHDHSL